MLALLVFGTGAFMTTAKFKYSRPGPRRDKNHSSFVNTPPNVNKKYNRQINPNEYGNIVAYAPHVNHRVKPNVNRSKPPTMIIGNAINHIPDLGYFAWAYVIISILSPPPPPPPDPPMIPILVTVVYFTTLFVPSAALAIFFWTNS